MHTLNTNNIVHTSTALVDALLRMFVLNLLASFHIRHGSHPSEEVETILMFLLHLARASSRDAPPPSPPGMSAVVIPPTPHPFLFCVTVSSHEGFV